jgi:hypothetical protein
LTGGCGRRGCTRSRSHDGGGRTLIQLTELLVHLHDVALGLAPLCEDAAFERRDLHCNLIRLELDQRLAGGDGVSLVLQPSGDGRLDDRFTEGRNLDRDHVHAVARVDLLPRREARHATDGRPLNITAACAH